MKLPKPESHPDVTMADPCFRKQLIPASFSPFRLQNMGPELWQVKEYTGFMAVSDTFEGLLEIMDRLRGPDGCPWDQEQDYASLRGYLLEEVYEVAQALDDKDEQALCEELGDLLFQIVFLSRIGKEHGSFTAQDVIRGIATKMVRRHPHVFGDSSVKDSEDVLRNWEEIKKQEKRDRVGPGEQSGCPGILDGIPVALPALQKAQRIGTKTARAGFFWKNYEDILTKVHEELGELHE
jgi:tetrapyrrole methylase family protein/MazG family protein